MLMNKMTVVRRRLSMKSIRGRDIAAAVGAELQAKPYAGFGLSRYAQRSAIRRFAIRQITIPAN
jgi:hypothetical protein